MPKRGKKQKQKNTPQSKAAFNKRRLKNLNELRDKNRATIRNAPRKTCEINEKVALYKTYIQGLLAERDALPHAIALAKTRLGSIDVTINQLEGGQERLEQVASLRKRLTKLELEIKRDDLRAEIEAQGSKIKTN